MIDIHCHILPEIDDGSPDIDTSLKMAAIAAQDGIHTIIATPHVGDNGLERKEIVEKVDFLNSELQKNNTDLKIYPGGEIQSHLAFSLANAHTLGSSNFVLVEFPHSFLPSDSQSLVRDLRSKGYRVIIAHAERNYAIASNPDKADDLVRAGAEIQITAESLTGFQGPDFKRCANYLLRKKMVRFIATDSHSPQFRKPTLSQAVRVASKVIGKKEAFELVTTNPERIIAGE